MTDQPPPPGRLARLFRYADARHVPLRTILVTVGVVAATLLAAQLIYRLRTLFLLIIVAGFVAVLLNPLVVLLQRRIPRRGYAVTVVTLCAVVVFALLAYAFGNPLVNGITHLSERLPSYVSSAEHGTGWLGHLATKYHVQAWVQKNAPKLVTYAESLSKPVLTVGKGAISLLIELFTIFVLILLLQLEAPKMRVWIIGQMRPERAATVSRIGNEISRGVAGYMLGNLLTSFIAGTVVFVTLLVLGVPFPLLWGLWVALVDFLPEIGGALAGIPTVIFAAFHSLTAGIVTLVVFLIYTQVENRILNPVIMSKTVRINPLLVLMSVLVGAELGNLVGGLFGAFVAALLAIPAAGALQVLVREAWHATDPKTPKTPKTPPEGEIVAEAEVELFPIVPDAREHDN
ncbi:MAG TPA: AI-2E family transporter [Streptosporangiaceae bacterium]|nr:AI-2E family transporter [Streptosporangiaceae bacterium]